MRLRRLLSRRPLVVSLALVLGLVIWQVALVFAQAPLPNPLAPVPPGNSIFAPVPGADITANGPAASIHGDPARGRILFARNCVTCHNDRGIGGISNPGSDDGTVPPLNPIDPGFLEQSQGDSAKFAQAVDLFVQHGSRPAGDNPTLSMIGWGDHQLLPQRDIADIEAYVMQLNGVYWPDRWAPPVEVRVDTTQSGNVVTYSITLINEGSSALGELKLQDSLPAGLAYIDSGIPGPGQNAGQLNGNTVTWLNGNGVPQGGTLGPFVVVAQVTGSSAPSNVAQLFFSWQTWDGTTYKSSAVSAPAIPGQRNPEPKPFSLTPTAVPSMSPTVVATIAATVTPAASPSAVATATTAPTPILAPATPTPVPAAPASASAQIVEPSAGALSWGFQPTTITIPVGGSITWTNTGTLQHTVTADDGSFDSGLIDPGTTWTFTFPTAGTYNYHCTPHPWMKATIKVQGS